MKETGALIKSSPYLAAASRVGAIFDENARRTSGSRMTLSFRIKRDKKGFFPFPKLFTFHF